MKLLATAMVIIAVLAVSDVYGQPYYGGTGRYGGYAPRSSTVGESYLRGSADLVRSAGERNLLNSKAAQGYAEARSMEMDNRLKYAETYFARRRVNQEYREANRKPPPTEEQIFRMAKSSQPNRLSPSQLDPVTGKIAWPNLLQTDQFQSERAVLEPLFAHLVKYGNLSFEQASEVNDACGKMRRQLINIIRDVPPREQMRANSFVDSLAFEARRVAG